MALPPSKALPSTQALEVDQQHVAVGGGALDRLELGEAFADALDLAVDDLIGRLRLGLADLEALVLAELGRRAHADLEFELERLALGLGRGDDLDAGVADRADAGARAGPARTTRAATRGSPPASTAPKPSRWITSEGGALPLRKPGIRISSRQARGRRAAGRGRPCSAGTSTSTRARESGSSVTSVFMEATLEDQPRDCPRRWARPVRTATAKSIAKAAPRPSGPVTSQARA